MSRCDCPTRAILVARSLLIVDPHPVTDPLAALLKRVMQQRSLIGRKNCRNPILATRKNSFSFAKIGSAPIGQLGINRLQDWANLLVLLRRQFHFRSPPVGRVREPPQRIALMAHFVLRRPHN